MRITVDRGLNWTKLHFKNLIPDGTCYLCQKSKERFYIHLVT